MSWKLKEHPKLPKGKIVAVVVLDGWGEAPPGPYNCISAAHTPNMDSLKQVLNSQSQSLEMDENIYEIEIPRPSQLHKIVIIFSFLLCR